MDLVHSGLSGFVSQFEFSCQNSVQHHQDEVARRFQFCSLCVGHLYIPFGGGYGGNEASSELRLDRFRYFFILCDVLGTQLPIASGYGRRRIAGPSQKLRLHCTVRAFPSAQHGVVRPKRFGRRGDGRVRHFGIVQRPTGDRHRMLGRTPNRSRGRFTPRATVFPGIGLPRRGRIGKPRVLIHFLFGDIL